jgi:hypothetical protein
MKLHCRAEAIMIKKFLSGIFPKSSQSKQRLLELTRTNGLFSLFIILIRGEADSSI